jgi:chorismate mutase
MAETEPRDSQSEQSTEDESLESLEARLRELDLEIMHLSQVRVSVAQEIMERRQAAGLPMHDLAAEGDRRDRVREGFGREGLRVYEALIASTYGLSRVLKARQSPNGTADQ